MTHPHERALEAAARALALKALASEMKARGYNDTHASEYADEWWPAHLDRARAAVTAYLQSAPPEIRIGQFVIRHALKGIWIGRTDGEGGEFGTEQVEHAIAQFYRANF